MDSHLEDALNLDSSIGVDFGNAEDTAVDHGEITLCNTDHDGGISMEFEQIEEQPMLMDAGNEEIVVSDFMESGQFSLQDYTVQDQVSMSSVMGPVPSSSSVVKKSDYAITTVPKQVPIAPKPPKLAPLAAKPYSGHGKLYAIAPKPAPKPVALVTASKTLPKKLSLSSVIPGPKGNAVLAQIGKQLVVLPAGSSQKMKLVSGTGSNAAIQLLRAEPDKSQLVTKSVAGGQASKIAKIIVQNQPNSESEASTVLSRIVPVSSNTKTHYVMHQKTVPISKANMMLINKGSPTKQTMKIVKKPQVVTISKSPSGSTTKKVVITANPPQNMIIKPSTLQKTTSTDGSSNATGQQTQYHQINFPGKGVQYIRLVAGAPAANHALTHLPNKGFVLADTPVTSKPLQKLVRIAPSPKQPQLTTQAIPRSSQSLLAPIIPKIEEPDLEQEGDYETELDLETDVNLEDETPMEEDLVTEEIPESKELLRALIEETVRDTSEQDIQQDELIYESDKSLETDSHAGSDHPLIVIPSSCKTMPQPENEDHEPAQLKDMSISIQGEVLLSYGNESQSLSDTDVSTNLGIRPRKACNCNKSQCLKLYCDCFANGEFCNGCNCTNCRNNLENEELRQNAIRGCLERNPNAFRPKIGKAKNTGPEVVRRHNKGCNCKRSGCLKNYCECYEAKIACTSMCKCVGCRNVEESLERRRPHDRAVSHSRQPCSFMTGEVIEAVCQCLVAVGGERGGAQDVLLEFARCLQDVVAAAASDAPLLALQQGRA